MFPEGNSTQTATFRYLPSVRADAGIVTLSRSVVSPEAKTVALSPSFILVGSGSPSSSITVYEYAAAPLTADHETVISCPLYAISGAVISAPAHTAAPSPVAWVRSIQPQVSRYFVYP